MASYPRAVDQCFPFTGANKQAIQKLIGAELMHSNGNPLMIGEMS